METPITEVKRNPGRPSTILVLIGWTLAIAAILIIRLGLPGQPKANQLAQAPQSPDNQLSAYIYDGGPLPQSPAAVAAWYSLHPPAKQSDSAAVKDELATLQAVVAQNSLDLHQAPAYAIRLASLAIWANSPPDMASLKPQIASLFAASVAGLRAGYFNAVIAACDQLEGYVAKSPNYPQLLSLRGSAIAQKAAVSQGNLDRITQIDSGLAQLDQAVALAPNDLSVLLARAYVELYAPEFLHKSNQAWADSLTILESSSPAQLQEIGQADRLSLISLLKKLKTAAPNGALARLQAVEANLASFYPAEGANK